MKTPVLGSLFNKVAGLQTAIFLKRDPNTGVFLWIFRNFKLFHDKGRYRIETSPFCRANQWTIFYMITASIMKELRTVFL